MNIARWGKDRDKVCNRALEAVISAIAPQYALVQIGHDISSKKDRIFIDINRVRKGFVNVKLNNKYKWVAKWEPIS